MAEAKGKWKIPVQAEKKCGDCGHVSDIYDLLGSVQEPKQKDEVGVPEVKVKCPVCGNISDWDVRFEN